MEHRNLRLLRFRATLTDVLRSAPEKAITVWCFTLRVYKGKINTKAETLERKILSISVSENGCEIITVK